MLFPQNKYRKQPGKNGFTLVELLLALFIFSLLTLFAYRATNTLLQAEINLEKENNALNALQKAFLTIERDFQQQFNHPAFTDNNNSQQDTAQTFNINSALQTTQEQALLEIKTLAGGNGLPQNVRYYTADNKLYRQQSSYTQAGETTATNRNNHLMLLAGISAAEARPISPPTQSTQTGIEFRLQHESLGTINRVFALKPAIEAPDLSQTPLAQAANQLNGLNNGPGRGATSQLSDEDRALINDN